MIQKHTFQTKIIKYFLGFMFIIYPLFFHDFFYNIVTCKFIVFISVTALFLFIYLMTGKDEHSDTIPWYRKLCWSDYFIIALFCIQLISVLFSYDRLTSFIGTDGRNAGIVTILCYLILYVILSRNYQLTGTFFKLLIIGSIPVSILGVLNYLYIDLLGFYKGLDYSQKAFYFSTLGHADVYASYFSLILVAVYILYLRSNELKSTLLYGGALILDTLGLLISGCESAGIILFVTYLLAIIVDHNKQNIAKFIYPNLFIMLFGKILIILNKRSICPRKVDVIFSFLQNNKLLIWLMILMIALLLLALINDKTTEISKSGIRSSIKDRKSILRNVAICILIVVPLIYILLLIYFSINRNIKLGSYENILRFNDQFGSYRGYIWRIVCTEFLKLGILKKLFGIGSDALYPFLYHIYGEKMYVATGAYYDNAHNEFLQYLITTGITGLISYVAFVISRLKRTISEKDKILACCILCYLAQSVVNINQVVTTPILFIMLSVIGTEKNDVCL